ncbi:hypothetical protein HK097_007802 [Rhizophlyctis rosea]|uniref:Ubiquitin-like domain-containing protein n=1 Tax=Rhizophlyctis rosea TaxID=64517 RepID=A0AAD5SLE8_9FUNG|nr:hypothetical protein HK097_007802 [Rhizophlyctis rosea]
MMSAGTSTDNQPSAEHFILNHLDLSRQTEILAFHNPAISPSQARQIVSEYRRFLTLKVHHRDVDDKLFSPSKKIKELWRWHILDTDPYAEMEHAVEMKIGHDPLTGKDRDAVLERRKRTKECYVEYFGEEPVAEVWDTSSTSEQPSPVRSAARSSLQTPNAAAAGIDKNLDDEISGLEPLPSPLKRKLPSDVDMDGDDDDGDHDDESDYDTKVNGGHKTAARAAGPSLKNGTTKRPVSRPKRLSPTPDKSYNPKKKEHKTTKKLKTKEKPPEPKPKRTDIGLHLWAYNPWLKKQMAKVYKTQPGLSFNESTKMSAKRRRTTAEPTTSSQAIDYITNTLDLTHLRECLSILIPFLTPERIDKRIHEYRRFLILKIHHQDLLGKVLLPSSAIEEAWCFHVLDTKAYRKMCDGLRMDVEYDPVGVRDEGVRRERRKLTRECYEDYFGEEASGEVWGDCAILGEAGTGVNRMDLADSSKCVLEHIALLPRQMTSVRQLARHPCKSSQQFIDTPAATKKISPLVTPSRIKRSTIIIDREHVSKAKEPSTDIVPAIFEHSPSPNLEFGGPSSIVVSAATSDFWAVNVSMRKAKLGGSFGYAMAKTDKLNDLASMLSNDLKRAAENLQLVVRGAAVNHNRTIEESGIRNGSTISAYGLKSHAHPYYWMLYQREELPKIRAANPVLSHYEAQGVAGANWRKWKDTPADATTTTNNETTSEGAAAHLSSILNFGGQAVLLSIGYRLGLFKIVLNHGSATSEGIANVVGYNERYVREWLNGLVASQIVLYNPATKEYKINPPYIPLIDVFAPEAQFITLAAQTEDKIVRCFKEGGGVSYGQFGQRFHDVMCDVSTATLLPSIIPEILPAAGEEVMKWLHDGIGVLEIGCGAGRATKLLAKHFPKSHFTGIDICPEAIEMARKDLATEKIENITYTLADNSTLSTTPKYPLILVFDAIHDQAHPTKSLSLIHDLLTPNGVFLMQDINGNTSPEQNVSHPVGSFLYAISLTHCMTVSLADGGEGLGTMWGRQMARNMLEKAGFGEVREVERKGDVVNMLYVCRK